MVPEKKNDFLGVSDSEDDQRDSYNSDDEITKGGRSAKRLKVDGGEDDNEASDVDLDAEDDEQSASGDAPEDASPKNSKSGTSKPRKDIPKLDTSILGIDQPLAKKNLITSESAVRKSGVVYMSRIPPGMKPSALRSLLAPYGKLNRIFLAPEDPSARARRRKAGGNKRVLFTEGWIEFLKKKEAKAACELLNGRNIGGKKGSFFRDDIWNLVYLKGFKWFNLTEQITVENAERTSRMRAEISKATKENKEFVRNVEKAKMLDGMQAKAKKRKAVVMDDDDEKPARGDGGRTFRQVTQVKKAGGLKNSRIMSRGC